METPRELVKVEQEYSDEDTKHEEVCFELIEKETYLGDGEKEVDLLFNGVKLENKELEHCEKEGSHKIKAIEYQGEEEMSCDW